MLTIDAVGVWMIKSLFTPGSLSNSRLSVVIPEVVPGVAAWWHYGTRGLQMALPTP